MHFEEHRADLGGAEGSANAVKPGEPLEVTADAAPPTLTQLAGVDREEPLLATPGDRQVLSMDDRTLGEGRRLRAHLEAQGGAGGLGGVPIEARDVAGGELVLGRWQPKPCRLGQSEFSRKGPGHHHPGGLGARRSIVPAGKERAGRED